jgi:hypothetical protein
VAVKVYGPLVGYPIFYSQIKIENKEKLALRIHYHIAEAYMGRGNKVPGILNLQTNQQCN